jgi:hypothetical protein
MTSIALTAALLTSHRLMPNTGAGGAARCDRLYSQPEMNIVSGGIPPRRVLPVYQTGA